MDRQGFEKIKKTFEGSSVRRVEIIPEPEEGEDVRFVSIRPFDRTRPAIILNILDQAGLICGGSEDLGAEEDPLLEPVLNDAFSITFKDINSR